jgi:hypothetical protein
MESSEVRQPDKTPMSTGQNPSAPGRSSFIVRVERTDLGDVRGVVERVRTGAKESFRGVEAIGAVIARMMEAEGAGPAAAPRAARTESRAPSRQADAQADSRRHPC